MSGGNILAKAVYDNLAETADELEFHRGDIVTVIEQNTADLEGWWLCSMNGRQGIAPGNRLRLIPMMHGIAQQQAMKVEPPMFNTEDDEYDVPKQIFLNQNDDDEVYDVPVARNFGSRSELDSQDPNEVYDVPPVHMLQNFLLKTSNENLLSSSPIHHRTVTIEQEVYDVPSNLIVTNDSSNVTNEYDPSELYDVPPIREGAEPEDVYDVPVSSQKISTEPLDVSAMLEQQEEEDEEYDIPTSRIVFEDTIDGNTSNFHSSTPSSKNISSDQYSSPDLIYDVPSSNRIADNSNRSINDSLNLSNIIPGKHSPRNINLHKQESEDYVYDVPPQVTRDQPPPMLQTNENESLDTVIKRLSLVDSLKEGQRSSSSSESLSSIIAANAKYTELNLELSSAIDKLIKLKQSLEDSVSNLLTHVYEGWRIKENISGKIGIIKSLFEVVLSAVWQYLDFARGAMANANAAHERGLSATLPRALITGMHKLIQPLEEDNLLLVQANEALNQACWSLSKLVSDETNIGVPDEIDSFVMTSRAVSDDARQMAAYIHTHSQYLFKRVEARPLLLDVGREQTGSRVIQTRPLPEVPQSDQQIQSTPVRQDEESWFEDYDYVALEEQSSPDGVRHFSPNIQTVISPEIKIRHKEVLQVLEMSNQQHGVPNVIGNAENGNSSILNDQFTLQDMVDDVPLLVDGLIMAIKRFYGSIDNSDPPKTFVSLSKQVILCAHELVFFGDTLYRRLRHQEMQDIIKGHCAELCTSLKRTVAATKHAAQHWPSGKAVQEMVDRVTDITASAHQFRIVLSQCSVR